MDEPLGRGQPPTIKNNLSTPRSICNRESSMPIRDITINNPAGYDLKMSID
jgi:hypothetical protein